MLIYSRSALRASAHGDFAGSQTEDPRTCAFCRGIASSKSATDRDKDKAVPIDSTGQAQAFIRFLFAEL